MFYPQFINFSKRSPLNSQSLPKFLTLIISWSLFKQHYKIIYISWHCPPNHVPSYLSIEWCDWAQTSSPLGYTHTFIVEMRVPHYLWLGALFTSTYLLNHPLSSPIGGKVFLHHLHSNRDLFSPSLGVWVCGLCPWSHTQYIWVTSLLLQKGLC